jgi:hypothetical protein
MLVDLGKVQYLHNNERDLEIPAVLQSVQRNLSRVRSLLDVGAHMSYAYYAPAIRTLLENRRYDAVDILADEKTAEIVDNYYQGEVCSLQLGKYDYVACISVLEHSGLTTYKRENVRGEQFKVFTKLLNLSNKHVFLSCPFGMNHIYPDQYANITDHLLEIFEAAALMQGFHVSDLQFYFSEFAPAGEPWVCITRSEASLKPMIRERGTQCVFLMELAKS